MNATKTVIMAMVVTFLAIGMTGFAMAGSSTDTYVGDGSYSTGFDGYGGDLTIKTYTPEGYDMMHCESYGYISGSQRMNSEEGWTEIDRDVSTGYGRTTTLTVDNAGDKIKTVVKGGSTYMEQYVDMTDDGVYADTDMNAYGYDASVKVVTKTDGTLTRVQAIADGYVDIYSEAYAETYEDGSESRQDFTATGDPWSYCFWFWCYYGEGDATIKAVGDEVEFDVSIHNDWFNRYPEGTLYGDPAVLILYDDYNRYYSANGYVYAVDLP